LAASETSQGDVIRVSRTNGRLDVVIDRPEKRNALSRTVLESLKSTFEHHATDEAVKVAVLRGSGDKSFAAGGDLNDLAGVKTRADAETMSRDARAALDAVRRFPVPVVAALNGDALGGGAELAVACDARIAAAHARIGFVQGRLAITTAWGGGIDLMSLAGPSRALLLLSRADLLSAKEAETLQLVDGVAGEGEPLSAAIDRFVEPMLRLPRHVLAAFKALNRARCGGAGREELENLETERFAETWIHEDHWAAADAIMNRRAR
jgi:enoyl-CoA hydratase